MISASKSFILRAQCSKIFNLDTLMAQVYDTKRDPDGFLYITYTDETTLGGGGITQ